MGARRFSGCILLGAALVTATASADVGEDATTATSVTQATIAQHEGSLATQLEQADVLWTQRNQTLSLDEAIALLQDAQTQNPQAFDVHWQLARFLYWKATESDRKSKAALAEQGWQAGQKAIQLNPNRVEGHYWAAACVGAWSDALGIPRSIAKGLSDKFEVPAKRAVEIDANHDGGGPLRVLGRFYATIPWPFKDVDKARGLLERALEAGPTSGTNLYFLADLAHQSKDDELGGAYLVSLITLEPSDGDGPEILRYQKVGKELAGQIQ